MARRHCREDRTCGRAQLPALDGTALRVYPYLLCRKVFRKLHLCISDNDIQRVVSNRPGVIESILCALREKMEAKTVHVGSTGTADPGHSGVDAARPWGELTSHPHTTKIQDPNVDNCSLSEPLCDSCKEHHYTPESWAHDDFELPNLHKKAGLQSPPAPSSTKILQNQRDLEKMGCCACRGWTFISQILPAHLLMIPILD